MPLAAPENYFENPRFQVLRNLKTSKVQILGSYRAMTRKRGYTTQ